MSVTEPVVLAAFVTGIFGLIVAFASSFMVIKREKTIRELEIKLHVGSEMQLCLDYKYVAAKNKTFPYGKSLETYRSFIIRKPHWLDDQNMTRRC